MHDEAEAVAMLFADGLLRREGERLRTARRWQSAMARAAARLYEAGDPGEDLRVPVASALLELYGEQCTDDEVALLIETMTPIEAEELVPRRMSHHGVESSAR